MTKKKEKLGESPALQSWIEQREKELLRDPGRIIEEVDGYAIRRRSIRNIIGEKGSHISYYIFDKDALSEQPRGNKVKISFSVDFTKEGEVVPDASFNLHASWASNLTFDGFLEQVEAYFKAQERLKDTLEPDVEINMWKYSNGYEATGEFGRPVTSDTFLRLTGIDFNQEPANLTLTSPLGSISYYQTGIPYLSCMLSTHDLKEKGALENLTAFYHKTTSVEVPVPVFNRLIAVALSDPFFTRASGTTQSNE